LRAGVVKAAVLGDIAGHDPTAPVRGAQRCRGFTATLTISGAQHAPSGWSIY
jgi:hypothetical protein